MIQTVWSGGVTRDGVTPITPGSSTALPRLLNVWLADGRALDDDVENLRAAPRPRRRPPR